MKQVFLVFIFLSFLAIPASSFSNTPDTNEASEIIHDHVAVKIDVLSISCAIMNWILLHYSIISYYKLTFQKVDK